MHRTFSLVLAHKDIRQFLIYAICGSTGVLTDLSLFSLLFFYGLGYQVANLVGYFAGTMVSFVLNRRFTFRIYDNTLRRMGLFFGAAAVGYAMSIFLLWAFVEKTGLHPVVAKLATLFFILVLQFTINRAVTFRPASKG